MATMGLMFAWLPFITILLNMQFRFNCLWLHPALQDSITQNEYRKLMTAVSDDHGINIESHTNSYLT
jgi:hypothetical protein